MSLAIHFHITTKKYCQVFYFVTYRGKVKRIFLYFKNILRAVDKIESVTFHLFWHMGVL